MFGRDSDPVKKASLFVWVIVRPLITKILFHLCDCPASERRKRKRWKFKQLSLDHTNRLVFNRILLDLVDLSGLWKKKKERNILRTKCWTGIQDC